MLFALDIVATNLSGCAPAIITATVYENSSTVSHHVLGRSGTITWMSMPPYSIGIDTAQGHSALRIASNDYSSSES